jgi:hypothetical protein
MSQREALLLLCLGVTRSSGRLTRQVMTVDVLLLSSRSSFAHPLVVIRRSMTSRVPTWDRQWSRCVSTPNKITFCSKSNCQSVEDVRPVDASLPLTVQHSRLRTPRQHNDSPVGIIMPSLAAFRLRIRMHQISLQRFGWSSTRANLQPEQR